MRDFHAEKQTPRYRASVTDVLQPLSDFQGDFNPADKFLQSRCASVSLDLLVM